MKKYVLRYSSIASLIIVVCMIISTVLYAQYNQKPASMAIGFAGMLLGFSAIYFALERYKRDHLGHLPFLEALKIGLSIAVIGSLSYTIVWMLEFQWVFPNFMDQFSADQIAQLKASGLTGEALQTELNKVSEMAKNYKNPWFRFGITFSEIVPFGLMIALLAAFILRKNKTS